MTGSELHIELRSSSFGARRPPRADLVSAAYGGATPNGAKLPKTMASDDARLGRYPCGIATQCGSRAPYSGELVRAAEAVLEADDELLLSRDIE
ncbi:MAG TPA: hypothetical protein VFN67_40755 [Polyangiales bacterium]|nr:hypothetical protein [Polyangiales bacterium]